MTLTQKLTRPLLIGATALALAAPAAQADNKDVALGIIGGLIVGKVIADSQRDRVNQPVLRKQRHTSQRQNYYFARKHHKRHQHGHYSHRHAFPKAHSH